ncbi:MAG: CHAT domain-containing protein [Caldilineaceae bacterium]
MITLELTIQRKTDDGWPVIAEQIHPGLLPIRSEGRLLLDQIALLGAITPLAYGILLGEALFQERIRDAFMRALAASDEDIRVLLFVETDDLRVLRWERLCAPFAGRSGNAWDFLVLNQRTLFSLYLPSLTDRSYPPIGRRDLRALVLIACPAGLDDYGLVDFDAAAAASQVQQALGGIPFDLLASPSAGSSVDTVVSAVGPASLDALCQQLIENQYTLVHVVCHGHYDRKSGETSLFLADNDDHLDRVTGTRLLERLGRLRGQRGLPHFAFLATCDSAAAEAEGALGGLAQRLVRELGMPAVIAMTEKVSIATAQLLTGSFYAHLQKHGEVDRALVEATNAIAERSDVTVPAIYSRLGGQPLFSQSLDRELTATEIAAGLDTLGALLTERAPVLETEFQLAADGWRRYLGHDRLSLTDAQIMEQREAQVTVEQIAEKALELSFKALCLGNAPPAYDARCPFRGLVAFGVADHAFFFGRERLIEQVQQQLDGYPFLAILGPSGSGKSSLVLAGLIPALQKKTPMLPVHVMTPGANPLAALTAAEEQLGLREPEAVQPALLVVDQFEESFTLCTDATARQRFFQQLLALIEQAATSAVRGDQPPLLIMLTMRADFWGECASYPHLRDQLLAHQMLIGPMTGSELRAAMEQQAHTVGLRFEADLANTILDDVAGEPGAMPLLQHGLRELWQRRYGRWLPAAEYRAMGAIKRAIAGSAEAIYQGLFAADQERMRALLLRLTRLDEEALPGDTRRDTRRRVAVAELIPTADERPPIIALIQQLADARLLVTSRNVQTDQDEVEVAHEALIREWPRLQEWITADVEGLRLQRQVADAIAQWQANGEDPSFLYRGRRLRAVQDWVRESPGFLNAQEQAFVAASTRRERLGLVRTWGTRAALVLVPVLVALGVMWIGSVGPFAEPKVDWQPVAAVTEEVRDIAWDAEGTLFVGLRRNEDDGQSASLIISHDNGKNWEHKPLPAKSVTTLSADPYVPGLVYVVSNDQKLWRTSDGGTRWDRLITPVSEVIDVTVSDQQMVYIAVGESDIYVSADRGVRWRLVENSPPGFITFLFWMDGHLFVGLLDGLWSWSLTDGWVQHLQTDLSYVYDTVKVNADIWVADNNGVHIVEENGDIRDWTDKVVAQLAVLEMDVPIVIAAVNTDVFWWSPLMDEKQNVRPIDKFDGANAIRTIRINPKQPDVIVVATDIGLLKGDLVEMIGR